MSKFAHLATLEELVPFVGKFQDRLKTSIEGKECTWHRFNVKVERGRIKTIQIVTDEQYTVDDKLGNR